MKKVLSATCFICVILLACNSNGGNEKSKVVSSADTMAKAARNDTAQHITITKDASQKEIVNDSIGNKILGIWALVGMENASFIIEKKKITYPETNASYKYFLVKDSMRIKFDGYDGNYLVKTRGADTLVLVGDEEQIYFRFKK